MEKNNSCYFCGKNASTVEHAPPRCIFPEEKDIGSLDYRKNLITVPSCELHNTKKSSDDEYFFFIVVGGEKKNSIGAVQFKTKLSRITKRSPMKVKEYLQHIERTFTVDKKDGVVMEKLALKINIEKLNRVLISTAKAIFYKTFNRVAYGKVEVLLNGCVYNNEKSQYNFLLLNIEKLADEYFENELWSGDNPEVFKYKIKRINMTKYWILLNFFEYSEYTVEINEKMSVIERIIGLMRKLFKIIMNINQSKYA